MEYFYETHLHTAESSACAASTAAEQVYAYKKKGYTGIIVTDHFINGNSTCRDMKPWDVKMKCFAAGYTAAKAAGGSIGLDVFFGWEYTIKGLDFLTYGLDIDFLIANPQLEQLSVEDYSALIRENGGYIAQAHPYRVAWYMEHSGPVLPHLLDGIEVFNAADSFKANTDALIYAEMHNLPVQAGSDSHNADTLRHSGIALAKKAGDIFDLINAIKNREVKII